MGDGGLKVDDSRLIVDLALYPGVGTKPPSLVIGPLDRATPEAADALLKTIEEISTKPLRLVLWADYLALVVPTIRSRSQDVWCPAGPSWVPPWDYLEEEAKQLCKAVLMEDPSRILGALEGREKDWDDLLHALCQKLADEVGGEHGAVAAQAWVALRGVLDGNGSILVAADALLPPMGNA